MKAGLLSTALAGAIGLAIGSLFFWFNDAPAERPEPLTIESLTGEQVVVLESVIVMPGEVSDRPFIEGRGVDSQGGVETISLLVDGAIRCGALIAWADRRANHFEFAIFPSQESKFYEANWPLTDVELVKCIQETTVAQFSAGVASNSGIDALVKADPSVFSALTVNRAANVQISRANLRLPKRGY